MNKIDLLKLRKEQLLSAGLEIRKVIEELTDEKSFVEQSTFSFSSSDLYPQDAQGEGVVCGFATIDSNPYYIIAQNYAVMSGGVSTSGCDKMLKCMQAAQTSATPIIYILQSSGLRIGQGVSVLEGMAKVLAKSAELKGEILQYAIACGNVYGQSALLASNADITFMYSDAVISHASPFVLSAKSNKNLTNIQVGGADALKNTGIVTFTAQSIKQISQTIGIVTDLLPTFGSPIEEYLDLNQTFEGLNAGATTQTLIESVFDKQSFVELSANFSSQVKCVIGRIGGISSAAIVFESGEGVKINQQNITKIKNFFEFAAIHNLPVINFVNCTGIEESLKTLQDATLKNISEYICTISAYDNVKIAVTYGKATGIGYTLFASKSIGNEYTYAFADAQIALFDSSQGAEIEFSPKDAKQKQQLQQRYAQENADVFNAAQGGFVDNIIEPALVKQYLIATLQMLLR